MTGTDAGFSTTDAGAFTVGLAGGFGFVGCPVGRSDVPDFVLGFSVSLTGSSTGRGLVGFVGVAAGGDACLSGSVAASPSSAGRLSARPPPGAEAVREPRGPHDGQVRQHVEHGQRDRET
ncbi:hypothetical protein ACU686_26320 [Yinghuangia aomiensis]